MDLTLFLNACVFPTTCNEATDFLRMVASMIQYNDVYAAFFPEEYQHSCALIEQRQTSLFPLYQEAYAPHEIHFLECVHTRLFPLGDLKEHLEEEAMPNNRWTDIPVVSLGFDDLYDEGLEYELFNSMSLGWHLLLYLIGLLEATFFDGMFGEEDTALFALDIDEGHVEEAIFIETCKEHGGPMTFFGAALDMLEHTTGTPFLDATSQLSGPAIPWTPQAVEHHRNQYHNARIVQKNADLFIQWIEADPIHHFTEVITLWNLCMKKTRDRKQMKTTPTG
jgi:hypothetical protein